MVNLSCQGSVLEQRTCVPAGSTAGTVGSHRKDKRAVTSQTISATLTPP